MHIKQLVETLIFKDHDLQRWKRFIPTEKQLEIPKRNLESYEMQTQFYFGVSTLSGGYPISPSDFKSILTSPLSEQVQKENISFIEFPFHSSPPLFC